MDELRHAATALLDRPPVGPTPVEELRRRNRRRHAGHRRLGAVVAAVVLLAGTAAAVGSDGGPAPDDRVVATPSPPRPPDILALGTVDGVDLVDPDGGATRHVALGGRATDLQWSPDGRTLAALSFPEGDLTFLRRDGTTTEVDLDLASRGQWVGPDAFHVKDNEGWHRVRTDGTDELLATTADEALWTPDGRWMAYLDDDGDAYVAEGDGSGARAVHLLPTSPSAGPHLGLADIAPDGQWLLLWSIPEGPSSLADGADLIVASTKTDRTTINLGPMLMDREWRRFSPDGERLLLVRGGGQGLTQPKRVDVCELDHHVCRTIEVPAGHSAFDATWSPDGRRIALSVAPIGGDWATTQLHVAEADELVARPVEGAGVGAAEPMWTSDGRAIVHVLTGFLYEWEGTVVVDRIGAAGGDPTRLYTERAAATSMPGRTRPVLAWAAEGG